jgi:hypothetical protein
MKVSGLYKGKYLIAVYDREGETLFGVFDNFDDIKSFGLKSLKTSISRYQAIYGFIPNIIMGKFQYVFIDIFEKNNDCFKEEDKNFVDFIIETNGISSFEFAKLKGINYETFNKYLKKHMRGEKTSLDAEIEEYLSDYSKV